MAKYKNILFRIEWWESIRWESNEDVGKALKILCREFFDEEIFHDEVFDRENLPKPHERIAMSFIQSARKDKTEWGKTCNLRSLAAKKRWEEERNNSMISQCKDMQLHDSAMQEDMQLHDFAMQEDMQLHDFAMQEDMQLHDFAMQEDMQLHDFAMQNDAEKKEYRNIGKENINKKNIYTSYEVLSSEAEDPPIRQPNFNYSPVLDGWNRIGLKQVIKLTDERRHKIRMRDKEISDAGFAWQMVFDRISNSDFLKGQNRNKWQATFDWLITNKENWLKVMEGNYDNKDGTQQQITSQNLESIRAAIALGGASVKADK